MKAEDALKKKVIISTIKYKNENNIEQEKRKMSRYKPYLAHDRAKYFFLKCFDFCDKI